MRYDARPATRIRETNRGITTATCRAGASRMEIRPCIFYDGNEYSHRLRGSEAGTLDHRDEKGDRVKDGGGKSRCELANARACSGWIRDRRSRFCAGELHENGDAI